jgi:hypothetical protein
MICCVCGAREPVSSPTHCPRLMQRQPVMQFSSSSSSSSSSRGYRSGWSRLASHHSDANFHWRTEHLSPAYASIRSAMSLGLMNVAAYLQNLWATRPHAPQHAHKRQNVVAQPISQPTSQLTHLMLQSKPDMSLLHARQLSCQCHGVTSAASAMQQCQPPTHQAQMRQPGK